MKVDFEKGGGLIPAIVQDSRTGAVLMLGYMNAEALEKTRENGLVTFYSRSRKRLWTKGEASGNHLRVDDVRVDCDNDTLLVMATPDGPVCHTGNATCFGHNVDAGFLGRLERVIRGRRDDADAASSYTARLFDGGTKAIAQKVGEEASEFVIDAVSGPNERVREEAADLVFHLLVALADRGLSWDDVVATLAARHQG
jgi:phosphoribosyl-ATP pyrophosphohydrolase/phosphoribosyl-AMP cyclohydrolase